MWSPVRPFDRFVRPINVKTQHKLLFSLPHSSRFGVLTACFSCCLCYYADILPRPFFARCCCCRPQAVGLQRVCQGAVEQFVEMKFEGQLMREQQRRQINQSVWQVGACVFHLFGRKMFSVAARL